MYFQLTFSFKNGHKYEICTEAEFLRLFRYQASLNKLWAERRIAFSILEQTNINFSKLV